MASRSTRHHPLQHSKSRVNRAGERFRAWWIREIELSDEEIDREFVVLLDFRQAHGYPLQMVASNLRHHVERCAPGGDVAQRLKRLPTILDKLGREPDMALARMEDVAGCRAIVGNEAEVRSLLDRLERSRAWRLKRVRDYIEQPKTDGYRAIHIVVEKEERNTEIQLRTRAQHGWAERVELIDRRYPDLKLKAGGAPSDVQEYFRLAADILAVNEAGRQMDAGVAGRFVELHRTVGEGLK